MSKQKQVKAKDKPPKPGIDLDAGQDVVDEEPQELVLLPQERILSWIVEFCAAQGLDAVVQTVKDTNKEAHRILHGSKATSTRIKLASLRAIVVGGDAQGDKLDTAVTMFGEIVPETVSNKVEMKTRLKAQAILWIVKQNADGGAVRTAAADLTSEDDPAETKLRADMDKIAAACDNFAKHPQRSRQIIRKVMDQVYDSTKFVQDFVEFLDEFETTLEKPFLEWVEEKYISGDIGLVPGDIKKRLTRTELKGAFPGIPSNFDRVAQGRANSIREFLKQKTAEELGEADTQQTEQANSQEQPEQPQQSQQPQQPQQPQPQPQVPVQQPQQVTYEMNDNEQREEVEADVEEKKPGNRRKQKPKKPAKGEVEEVEDSEEPPKQPATLLTLVKQLHHHSKNLFNTGKDPLNSALRTAPSRRQPDLDSSVESAETPHEVRRSARNSSSTATTPLEANENSKKRKNVISERQASATVRQWNDDGENESDGEDLRLKTPPTHNIPSLPTKHRSDKLLQELRNKKHRTNQSSSNNNNNNNNDQQSDNEDKDADYQESDGDSDNNELTPAVTLLARMKSIKSGKPSVAREYFGHRRQRVPWSEQEVIYLMKGVLEYGHSEWAVILKNYEFQNRTSVDIKDKWRNLMKQKGINLNEMMSACEEELHADPLYQARRRAAKYAKQLRSSPAKKKSDGKKNSPYKNYSSDDSDDGKTHDSSSSEDDKEEEGEGETAEQLTSKSKHSNKRKASSSSNNNNNSNASNNNNNESGDEDAAEDEPDKETEKEEEKQKQSKRQKSGKRDKGEESKKKESENEKEAQAAKKQKQSPAKAANKASPANKSSNKDIDKNSKKKAAEPRRSKRLK